jgi:hypothetical protein
MCPGDSGTSSLRRKAFAFAFRLLFPFRRIECATLARRHEEFSRARPDLIGDDDSSDHAPDFFNTTSVAQTLY